MIRDNILWNLTNTFLIRATGTETKKTTTGADQEVVSLNNTDSFDDKYKNSEEKDMKHGVKHLSSSLRQCSENDRS